MAMESVASVVIIVPGQKRSTAQTGIKTYTARVDGTTTWRTLVRKEALPKRALRPTIERSLNELIPFVRKEALPKRALRLKVAPASGLTTGARRQKRSTAQTGIKTSEGA